MELSLIWNIFFMIFGLIAGLVKSVPTDFDSVKEGMQMAMLNGAGMAKDFADNANVQGSSGTKMNAGPIGIEQKHEFKAGGGGDVTDDDDDEERKRRRRSVATEEEQPALLRKKRSPCMGRKRAQQTTAAPAAGGGGGSGAGGGGGGGAGDGSDDEGANPDDPRRRRKRSPQDYENDINGNVIPDQQNFGERTQEIGERFRQLIKGMLDSLAGAFEKLRRSIQNGSNNPAYDMQK